MATSNSTSLFFSRTFHYQPSELPILLVLGPFVLVTIVSLASTCRYGGRFMYIVPATAAFETFGYGLRLATVRNASLNAYIVSTLFILTTPIALALVNYIVVSKLLLVVGKPVTIFRPSWKLRPERIAKIFFRTDMSCFFLQCSGGGLLASGNEGMVQIGNVITLIGLVLQFVLCSVFIYVLHKVSTSETFLLNKVRSLDQVFIGLRLTVAMLLVRNIYRVAEYASGSTGPVVTTEWTFYVFETFPILTAFSWYCMFHFGMLLESNNPNPYWQLEYQQVQSLVGTKDEAEDVHEALNEV